MKKRYVLILILILTVGFASINTVLDLKGNVSIGFKEDDFNVEISKVVIDEGSVPITLSTDKQSFTFTGTGSNKIEYTITNRSYQYDANVNLICEPNNNLLINQVGEVVAQSRKSATIESNTNSQVTCRMDIDKISKTEIAEDMCEYDVGQTWEFNYTGSEQEFIVPCDGDYKIELWGASGGNAQGFRLNIGGKGAYVAGEVNFTSSSSIYITVGGVGENALSTGKQDDGNLRAVSGGYNGGGNAAGLGQCTGAGGGGATHVSLATGLLKNQIKSNVLMVAAGGGGASRDFVRVPYEGHGGAGGILKGIDGNTAGNTQCLAYGGTQTAGGGNNPVNCGSKGAFGGNLAIQTFPSHQDGGGGGSGYYAGANAVCSGGGGGSSYINESTMFTAQNANYLFNNIETHAGNEAMPKIEGSGIMTGNTGHGYAKITYLG